VHKGNILKKQPGGKKGVALFKMANMKKVVKSKGAAKKWLWWYRLMAKISITTFQAIYRMLRHSSFTRNQHKIYLNCYY